MARHKFKKNGYNADGNQRTFNDTITNEEDIEYNKEATIIYVPPDHPFPVDQVAQQKNMLNQQKIMESEKTNNIEDDTQNLTEKNNLSFTVTTRCIFELNPAAAKQGPMKLLCILLSSR